ncbi:MAG TPA: 23S rRNA (adenine(2503)-C(2))-methyltransferase RlmN [bacterium]|nr:23S rRNA (adenine(2503)-C(2))-methyltransferase RlmN [bacterium]HQO91601.1 23S rRNA (adenine(2503)-C(2))-methyltransferase RlmN [bacterium]
MEILEFTRQTFENAIESAGYPKFRARQIIRWIYHRDVYSFEEMTDLSKDDRVAFQELFSITPICEPAIHSSDDGTKKLTFMLEDGAVIESVIIPEEKRNTLCISTQAGCPLKCSFCRTGTLGFKRNLSVREIVGQVIRADNILEKTGEHLNNIVYMGMGEPLLNFENVVDSILILMDDLMLNFSNRRITVSTAGIADKIIELGEKTAVNLAISLHAVNDEKRSKIMDINKKFPIGSLINAARYYPAHQRKKVMLEYIMLKGFNDTAEDAKELAKIANQIDAKVNLIAFNTFEGAIFEPTPMKEILKFQEILISKNVTALLRKSRGSDELAACGQLGKV